jgi:hypothetical protein
MNWKGYRRKWRSVGLRRYLSTCLEGLRNILVKITDLRTQSRNSREPLNASEQLRLTNTETRTNIHPPNPYTEGKT